MDQNQECLFFPSQQFSEKRRFIVDYKIGMIEKGFYFLYDKIPVVQKISTDISTHFSPFTRPLALIYRILACIWLFQENHS